MSKEPYTPSDHSALIARALNENHLPGAEHAARLSEFANRLLTVNQVMNLTAITEPKAVALKHFADSLALLPHLPSADSGALRVVDVGCGAGFPSLPLAIAAPHLRVLAMDSTAKRIRFIQDCASEMGIVNLSALTARAEEAGNDPLHRESFDISTARAVADLSVLSELCLPLTKVGGVFCAMKSGAIDDELTAALPTVKLLGGQVVKTVTYTLRLDEEEAERSIVIIEKVKETPKNYPRSWGKIKKSAQSAQRAQ